MMILWNFQKRKDWCLMLMNSYQGLIVNRVLQMDGKKNKLLGVKRNE